MNNSRGKVALWPERILGPRPGLKEINVFCWSLFIGCIFLPLFVVLLLQIRSGSLFFKKSAVDFVYFYGTGRIAADHSARDVYNYTLQLDVFNKILPLHEGTYGPSPYPPFVSQFFRLFAWMPFIDAYLVWIGISITLYIVALSRALKDFSSRSPLEASLILCFALSFYPFLRGTLINGQLSCVAFIAIAVALSRDKQNKPFQSGLALSVLTYKPTLLLLLLPMFLLSRRFKVLSGFITGTALLVAVATMLSGAQIWPAYAHFLNAFGHTSGLYGQTALRLSKYVDFNSFSYALTNGRSPAGLAILLSISAVIAACLAVLLWKSARGSQPMRNLAWAMTLTWTMLLNVYYPMYDTILVIISVVLTLAATRELNWASSTRRVSALALLVFATSWITESFAEAHRVQLLTLSILALGIAQMLLLRRAIRQGTSETISLPLTA